MHSCDRYREALSARLDGEDPGMSGALIDAHLDGCADCRAWAAAARGFSGSVDLGEGPALRQAVMTEILDRSALLNQSQQPVRGWRVALAVVAILQLTMTWIGRVVAHGHAPPHAVHELASWDLGLAFGLLLLAWLPWRAWGALPVVAVIVTLLAGTSVGDLLTGQATVSHEAVHVLQLAGLACLWRIARSMPRSSVVLRLTAP